MVKILFLVKNGQKGRHGCVKSEHVLWDQKVSQKVRKLILLLAKIQRKLARTSRKRAHTFHGECLHLQLKEFTPANIGLPT